MNRQRSGKWALGMVLVATVTVAAAAQSKKVQMALEKAEAVTQQTLGKWLQENDASGEAVKVPTKTKVICFFEPTATGGTLNCVEASTNECPSSVEVFIENVGLVTANTQNCKHLGGGECDCDLVLQ